MKPLRNLTACTLLLTASLLNSAHADDYVREAEAYLEKGEAKAAVIQLKNALQENPANIEARLMLGRIYLQAGDGASAEKEFERAKKLNAAKSYWELNLAKAYLMQQKYQEILDSISEEEGSSIDDRISISLIRGDAHLGLRQYKEARDTYSKVKQLNPQSQEAVLGLIITDIAENHRAEALNSLDGLLADHPDNTAALVMRGELNLQSGKAELARADFDKALTLQPKNVRALLGRAQIYLTGGQIDLSKADLATLDTLVPGHPKLLHLSGAIALLERNLDEADNLLQKALNANPDDLRTRTLLGAANFYRGNYEAAHGYLTQVLKAQPTLLPAIKLLASVRHQLKQSDAVVKLLEPALGLYPEDPQLMAMLGAAYMQVKRFEEGSELMSRAIEIAPDLAAYRTQLALGLMAQGKSSEAIAELENTIGMEQEFVQADVLLVLSYLNKQEFTKALEASQALEKRSPENPVGYNLTGLAYLMSGNLEQAEHRFKKTLEIDPNFITAEANLARLAIQKGDLTLAESHFQSALKKIPNSAMILMGLADLARRQGDRDRMHKLLEQAHNGEPKTSRAGLISAMAYLAENRPLKALRMTSQLSAAFPRDPSVLTIHGRAQLAAGDTINAVTTFRQLTYQKKSAETLQLLGNAQQAAGQQDDARESYQQALKENPGFVPVLVGLFSLELGAGNHQAALSHAKTIQQAMPDKPVGYEFEGTVYAAQGETVKSITLYEKAYQMQPGERLGIMLAQQYTRAGDARRGLDLLREWAEKQPDNLQVQISLAGTLLEQGLHDEAIQTYEKVLQADDSQLIALNNLAWIYSSRGNDKAVELGKRAYELASTRPEIVDTYGWILVQTGDLSKGSEILKQAAELSPNNQEIIYHLGYAQHKQGNRTEAETILKRAIAINDKTELAKSARKLLEN
ncbi:XrtA/PEP-CTERM system TPR-repeat protein PrsT [Sedimenticola sp.]|uniref:XrtA/PEP-CTERM system TPR-repeat protein PrsT n=1 Tax=Sedimenticola sp. TaxID=1940285 RepID=UPI00258B3A78|nr:XrtA/PEP-CTERM system TPR-repeat protein PrsT [Sedimenticola sp.]MCW8902356.1 PEP-CTERM system TPR-repeat protein PrsT [Sedimenticola sp.]